MPIANGIVLVIAFAGILVVGFCLIQWLMIQFCIKRITKAIEEIKSQYINISWMENK